VIPRPAARSLRGVGLLLALALGDGTISPPLQAQTAEAKRLPVPFEAGELLTYDVKFGAIKVGSARLQVLGVRPVRDRSAWHIRFDISGGTFFYQVNDAYESWMDVTTLNSLRFRQDQEQGSRERERVFEIFPERAVFQETWKQDREVASVRDPLDDGSFLYFIRTLGLEVGRTYSFNRYFKPDRNPVVIRVLRRERIQVPAGSFNTIVIQPIIKTRGIFAEGGQAEIWLTDDQERMMVQMKSRMSVGSLSLFLRSFRRNATGPVEGTRTP
jgi:hypothetical protein